VWIGAGIGGEQTALYVDDLATIAAALTAATLCGWAAIRHQARLRLFWWLLAGGCGAWALGEMLWALYDLVGGEVPVPSWADAAYLAALPPVAAALLVHPALHARAIGRLRSLVDGLVIAASVFFVGWALVFKPIGERIDLTSLGDVVTLAYPLSDVVIIFLVVLVIRGTTNSDRWDLRCLLAGLLLITFSDAVYSYLTNVEDYSSGNVIDIGWLAGYLGIALGAFYARRPQLVEQRPAASPTSLTPAALVAPFFAMLAALGLMMVKLELGHSLDRVTLATAFALVVLILGRQALLFIDLLTQREREGTMADRLVAALGDAAGDRRVDHTSAPTPLR
jgi:hypothetical protein